MAAAWAAVNHETRQYKDDIWIKIQTALSLNNKKDVLFI